MELPIESSNIPTGLTSAEVRERFDAGKYNKPIEPPSKSIKQIVLSNVFTYFNLIFIVISTALLIFGRFADMAFMAVIIFNTVIGIVQEIKSKKTLDSLKLLTAPMAEAVRDGEIKKIPTEELVIDDLIVLGTGAQICADAKVVSGEITVNEALVTGESDEITKKEGSDLLSGSFVISGKCIAKLTAVGEDSFVSKLTIDAKKMKKKQRGGMMLSLTRLIQVIGVIIIPIAVLLIINEIENGQTAGDAVSHTSAALIGMIPEGLYLLTSVALAVSVMRLAKKKTLVHELGCIETLARVDMLCVDKTGTITESEMKVLDAVPLDAAIKSHKVDDMISCLVSNLAPDNDTMKALHAYYARDNYPRASRVVPFSSKYKYSAASIENVNYVIGAPEFILGNRFENYRGLIEEQIAGGCRVLLFAVYAGELDGSPLLPTMVSPVALVKLINPVRENAAETFGYFNEQGVEIKVISGDSPRTASEAALSAKIPNAEKYIDLSSLPNDEAVEKAATEYTVFGRVTPDRKRVLIRALKKAGHTVAMTGDGVNDVLALKEADCSIAMASGSDVAAQVSNLVLLESDFAALPSVVDEGRRVINNIERTASLFLVKNIFSVIFALIAIIWRFSYPIEPSSLTLVNVVTIGAPSFFLALEPNHKPVTGKFLRNVLYRAAPAAFCDLFVLIGITMFKSAFDIPPEESSTVCIVLIGFVGLIMLFYVCRPFAESGKVNYLHIGLMTAMPLLFLMGLFIKPDLFHVHPLSYGSVLVMCVFMLLAIPVMFINRIGLKKLNKLWHKIAAHFEESGFFSKKTVK